MWNKSKEETPRGQILEEHMRALARTIDDAAEEYFEPADDIEEALAWLEKQSTRSGGFNRYRRGLRNGDRREMVEGLNDICRHLGVK
jgi:DNA repair exonuclease SbcCD ATPase subunit